MSIPYQGQNIELSYYDTAAECYREAVKKRKWKAIKDWAEVMENRDKKQAEAGEP